MTLQAKIERDLTAGPSTASALSQRLRISIPAIEHVLKRLQNEESVRARTISDGLLTVWSLNNKISTHTPKQYDN